MGKRDTLSKFLAIFGTCLVWLPLVAPVIFGIIKFVRSGRSTVDFLMPAELLPIELVGAGLLIWVAFRLRRYTKLITWTMVAGLILLFGGQTIAMVTGLASGAIEPKGWIFILVTSMIVAFDLALVAVGVGGVLLVHALFNRPQ